MGSWGYLAEKVEARSYLDLVKVASRGQKMTQVPGYLMVQLKEIMWRGLTRVVTWCPAFAF
jgi:hypothetical protein